MGTGNFMFHNSHHSNSSLDLRNLLNYEPERKLDGIGTPPQGADPTMDTHDWRAQLLPHIRQRKVNEIMTKLKNHQSHGDDDESLDAQKISKSFERKTYAGALSQEDYLKKISSMMRLIDSCKWRAQLQPAIRQRIVIKMTDTLKKHTPVYDEEGLVELHGIAIRFEEKIYTAATSQADYLRKVSLKMLTMDRRGQNTVANSMPSNFGPSETGSASGQWGSSARMTGGIIRESERNAAVRLSVRKRKQPQ